jgi:hypothetical protein
LSLGLLLIVWNCFLVTMYLLVLGLLYGMGYFIVARLVAHCVELFSSYNVLTCARSTVWNGILYCRSACCSLCGMVF